MSRIPRTIGPYRILELLGRGGMGVVYRAEHRVSGRTAALKTVRVPLREGLAALRREIHALAQLRHPGIVPIYEEGLQRGVPWYAMELLEGRSLRGYLDSEAGGAAAGSARGFGLGLVRRLCAALGFLHGEGLVHRDLKPENVLLRNFEFSVSNSELELHSEQRAETQNSKLKIQNPVWPVLMDFGVVSRFAGEMSREQLEQSGRTSGTVGYMAPEQICGELCDARADLYSVGCILYELCTGRPPFTGPGAVRVLRQHLEEEPEPPGRLARGLPERLEALILGLLQKDPRKRPGYAGDVEAELSALEGGEEGAVTLKPSRGGGRGRICTGRGSWGARSCWGSFCRGWVRRKRGRARWCCWGARAARERRGC